MNENIVYKIEHQGGDLEQYTLFEKTEDEIKYEAFVDKFKPKKTTDQK